MMQIKEKAGTTNDFIVEDITEEEQEVFFKLGLQALVDEAREGKTQFIVLPPEALEGAIPNKNKLTVEIDDDEADALVQVGIVKALMNAIEYDKIDEEYYERLGKLATDTGEVWDDERIDIIGQNGNDGLHYNEDKEGM